MDVSGSLCLDAVNACLEEVNRSKSCVRPTVIGNRPSAATTRGLTSIYSRHIGDTAIFLKGLGSAIKNHTLVAALLSIGLLLVFFWWFGPRLLLGAAYAVVGLIATLTVPIIYRLFGFNRDDENQWLAEREEREYHELSQQLKHAESELARLGIDDGVRQARQLNDLLEDYHSVVETRFIGKKHMPLEYLGAARRVQKHAVQNLSDMVAVGHSLSTIDSSASTSASETAASGSQKRIDRHSELQAEQQTRLQGLLDENRKMFDALTETAVEVANINSFSNYERIDTLARLVSLAEIASNSGK